MNKIYFSFSCPYQNIPGWHAGYNVIQIKYKAENHSLQTQLTYVQQRAVMNWEPKSKMLTATYFWIREGGAKTPKFCLHVKYRRPFTDPSFLPTGLSSSMPNHKPIKTYNSFSLSICLLGILTIRGYHRHTTRLLNNHGLHGNSSSEYSFVANLPSISTWCHKYWIWKTRQ